MKNKMVLNRYPDISFNQIRVSVNNYAIECYGFCVSPNGYIHALKVLF